jgi:hypothetical protein
MDITTSIANQICDGCAQKFQVIVRKTEQPASEENEAYKCPYCDRPYSHPTKGTVTAPLPWDDR